MYTQEFRVSDESLPALLKIADFLLIEPLVEDIIAYLKKILATILCQINVPGTHLCNFGGLH